MKRDDELPIEALPEASWNRVERAVYDELDAAALEQLPGRRWSPPRWGATLAGVIALQLGAAALFLLARSDSHTDTDGKKHAVLTTARFTSGSEASEALLGDVSVRLEHDTALTVVESGELNSLVLLERGAARFSVPKRGERPAFVVQAGDARIEVIGTQFRVERSAGSAAVEAYEGKVRVSAHGQSSLLTRGMRWPAPVAAAVATATPTTMKPAAQEPTAAQPAVAQPVIAARAQDGTAQRPDRQRERFEQAAAVEASDPARALRLYRALAGEKGAWGENALYAMGRLELELGQRSRAQKVLHRYLERHPKGANAADAKSLLQRLGNDERSSP